MHMPWIGEGLPVAGFAWIDVRFAFTMLFDWTIATHDVIAYLKGKGYA